MFFIVYSTKPPHLYPILVRCKRDVFLDKNEPVMHYLTIKKQPSAKRQNGREVAQAYYVHKARKYGKVIEQQCISVKRPILVTGANASGKTRWLTRLHESSGMIWNQRTATPLYLSAARPLSAWTDTKPLELWWAGRDNPSEIRHWTKLKAWERVDALPLYLEETGAVLFVDDAHLITGRKLKVLEECVRAAAVFVMGAEDEGRLGQTVRRDVLGRKPQVFRLSTDVAYDATPLMMWFLIVIASLMQFWILVAVLGGIKLLGSGRRATKQT